MNVAITGAEGFTGRYVCAELDRRGVPWVSIDADLRNSAAIDAAIMDAPAFDSLIHLAAIAFAGGGDWKAFYDVNQLGSFNLLESVARHRPGIRCVIASSAQVYGASATGIIGETHICEPSNHYGISKYAMELGVRNWADKLEIVITRPFNYTGVGQESRYLVPKLVDSFKRRLETVELGNISVRRDFGDARAVSEIYCDLALSRNATNLVNVGSGRLYSVQDIIYMLAALTGHEINVAINPAFVRANEPEILGCDTTKLRSIIPNMNYPELSDTLQWMLSED